MTKETDFMTTDKFANKAEFEEYLNKANLITLHEIVRLLYQSQGKIGFHRFVGKQNILNELIPNINYIIKNVFGLSIDLPDCGIVIPNTQADELNHRQSTSMNRLSLYLNEKSSPKWLPIHLESVVWQFNGVVKSATTSLKNEHDWHLRIQLCDVRSDKGDNTELYFDDQSNLLKVAYSWSEQ
jgi:hypothetical protein